MSRLSATDSISEKALGILMRKTSTDEQRSISGFRATTVIDTPHRKTEVLESLADGRVMVRDVTLMGEKADVRVIHLAYHEARALGNVLLDLEEREPQSGNGKAATA